MGPWSPTVMGRGDPLSPVISVVSVNIGCTARSCEQKVAESKKTVCVLHEKAGSDRTRRYAS